jgi:hypothetical protein
MATLVFQVFIGGGVAFLLYVFVQFWREGKRPNTPPAGERAARPMAEKVLTMPKNGRRSIPGVAAAILTIALYPCSARGQEKDAPSNLEQRNSGDLRQQIVELRGLLERLQARIDTLEKREQSVPSRSDSSPAMEKANVGSPGPSAAGDPQGAIANDPGGWDALKGTTLNLTLDGYYGYNFNRPLGRVNLLRAYDVTSNSFSLNQAALIVENAPDVPAGKRFGARLDLQFGQATETLQGSAANEPRPQVYRHVFQAYGTYVVPLGSGLTVDFGKWASAMGIENNYTKDQINYSRSYLFDFLPFYHMGVRSTYPLNDKLTLSYWLVNGVQQTEDFNGFKSQVLQVIFRPRKTVVWEVIYHVGKEQHDLVPALNPGLPGLPTQPGLSTTPINPAPDGQLHILDSYVTWNANAKLTLAAEADYAVSRLFSMSAPLHVTAGAAYARYQLTPRFALAARAEYLSDRGGLFSGLTQALKETTFTTEYKFAEGFLMRQEWRRDFSNRPFFLTETPGVLKKEQNTATVGLIWWFGGKKGAW